MKTFTNILLLLFMVVILSRCDSQTQVSEMGIQSLEQITGFYTIQVTRIAERPAVQFPTDTLLENQYKLDRSNKKYKVLFFSEGNQISMKNDSIIGQRSYQSSQFLKYDLVQGLPAGGRFNVWLSGESMEAELTIYGSGVPITISERGKLIKE